MRKAAYRLFLFVLIFSPLAFGAVEAWSLAVMQCATALAALLLVLRRVRSGDSRLYETPGALPLLCIIAYMILQVVPLPPQAVKLLSPGSYEIYGNTAGAIGPEGWFPISVNREATVLETVRFASYALFYFLTIQFLSSGRLLKRTTTVVVAFATLLAVSSILQHFVVPEKVLWFRELTKGGIPFGPYVNRSHYAGFMGMVLPVAVGLMLVYKPRVTYKSVRESLVEIFNQRRTNLHVLLIFSSVIIGASVFVSLSRGGIISLCLSMLVLGILLLRRDWKRGQIIMLVFVLLLLSVGWFGWEPVFERFASLRDESRGIADLRVDLWKDSLGIIGRFPIFGAGFGTYVHVFKKFGSLPSKLIVDHAHNDYIEILAEGGIVGFALVIWFLSTVMYRTLKTVSARVDSYSVYLTFGAVAGIASVMFHGVTDFNLHIGANGLCLFFLLGFAISAAHTRVRKHSTYLESTNGMFQKRLPALSALLAVVVIAGNMSVLLGKATFSSVEGLALGADTTAQEAIHLEQHARNASFLDPYEAKYRFARANAALILSNERSAVDYYRAAMGLDPLNGEYSQKAGLTFSLLEDHETAERLLMAGVDSEPLNPARHRQYASWLLSHGEREKGLEEMSKAISIEPEQTRSYITVLLLQGTELDELSQSLPKLTVPYLDFGDFLLEMGRDGMAEEAYLKAVEYAQKGENVSSSIFYRVFRYFRRTGRSDEALRVMQKAARLLPEDAGIRITLGRLYEETGVTYRAIEEYRKALMVDSGNIIARNRLESLESGFGPAGWH